MSPHPAVLVTHLFTSAELWGETAQTSYSPWGQKIVTLLFIVITHVFEMPKILDLGTDGNILAKSQKNPPKSSKWDWGPCELKLPSALVGKNNFPASERSRFLDFIVLPQQDALGQRQK